MRFFESGKSYDQISMGFKGVIPRADSACFIVNHYFVTSDFEERNQINIIKQNIKKTQGLQNFINSRKATWTE